MTLEMTKWSYLGEEFQIFLQLQKKVCTDPRLLHASLCCVNVILANIKLNIHSSGSSIKYQQTINSVDRTL